MAPQTCLETENPNFERLETVRGMDETIWNRAETTCYVMWTALS
jgi:hypothetical protein